MDTRFATAKALFDEYATLRDAVKIEPTDDDPVSFARKLANSGKMREASAVCAYILQRREAVWWACQCLRLRSDLVAADDNAFKAAEAWVARPSDESRDLAKRWAQSSDQTQPATLVAHAAGFSSGNLAEMPDGPVRVPPHLTAECVRVAIVAAETRLHQDEAKIFLRDCLKGAFAMMAREGAA